MVHRAPVLPYRPVVSTVAFRVRAARASDIVLADGPPAAPAAATPTAAGGSQPAGRRRRRTSRRRAVDTSLGGGLNR